MKRILFTLTIILSSTLFAQDGGGGFFSNIEFGVRANALINTTDLGKFEDAKELGEHGFNIGLAAKINITDKFFVTPEVYYNHVGTSEISMPILLGYSFLGDKLDIIAGPNLSYALESDTHEIMPNFDNSNTLLDFYYNGFESTFDVGYIAGLQYHLGKFMITARYQGQLMGKEVGYSFHDEDFVVTGAAVEEIKSSFGSIGIGYNF